MLTNEYQADPNETEEERKRRLAQQQGTTPTVEAQPSYTTTTAPSSPTLAPTSPKPEAPTAAPQPTTAVAAPAPVAWDGGLATGFTQGSLAPDVAPGNYSSGSGTGNLADLNAQMVGGSVWDAAAQRWRSTEEMTGVLNAARQGSIIDGFQGMGVVEQAAAPGAQLASVAHNTNPLAVEQNTLRQLDPSKIMALTSSGALPSGIGAGEPSLLEALQKAGIPLSAVLGGQAAGANGTPLPIDRTMAQWLPGMGAVPGTPSSGFYEGRTPAPVPAPGVPGGSTGNMSPAASPSASPAGAASSPMRAVGSAGAGVAGGVQSSQFGPGNDLRSTQFSPADSPDQAVFREQRMGLANAVANGANRSQIAQERLAAFDQAAEPGIREGIRKVGQQASKFGRLGMGQTEVETLRPYTDYLTQRAALSHNLAADTAEGEIGDRLNSLGAIRSLFGDEEGVNASRRGELRGERDWQQTLAQLAFENAFRTRGLENQEQAQQFGQGIQLANLGYGSNPYTTMLAGSQQYGNSAGQSWDALAQLLAPYLNRGA